MYCFVDDGKNKEVYGIICFRSKEEVVKAYEELVSELCRAKRATEVFEIKRNKVELKGSKLRRKGIEFCSFVNYLGLTFCVKKLRRVDRSIRRNKFKVIGLRRRSAQQKGGEGH